MSKNGLSLILAVAIGSAVTFCSTQSGRLERKYGVKLAEYLFNDTQNVVSLFLSSFFSSISPMY